MELVSQTYWWPHMSRYIGQYCQTCEACIRSKAWRTCPLEIPGERWEHISVDFIMELPEAHGTDAIMLIIDSAGKRGHFIPTTTTITALGAANLYFRDIWKLHGLP